MFAPIGLFKANTVLATISRYVWYVWDEMTYLEPTEKPICLGHNLQKHFPAPGNDHDCFSGRIGVRGEAWQRQGPDG